MPHFPAPLLPLRASLLLVMAVCTLALSQQTTGFLTAQVYNGPGLEAGANEAAEVEGIVSASPRAAIARIVNQVLTFVALIAVIAIIIAGLYLILGLGSDSAKDTAKKIVLYTIIGLVLILLAKVIVTFFITIVS